jgi:hypothetical protein
MEGMELKGKAIQKSESERLCGTLGKIKEECLAKLILLGEGSLRRALQPLRSPLS